MRRIKELIPLLLLGLYLSYQAGATMFTHVHYINGERVVHSHPSKSKKHTHTARQILLIYQLSHAQTLEASAPQRLEKPALPGIVMAEEKDRDFQPQVLPLHSPLRAPPSFRS